MKNASYDDLVVFAEVARAKGFRAAADNLNLSAGSVSETIQRIEHRLGIRLIERTTRKMSLTNAGVRLFERTLPALADLDSALSDLGEEQGIISGTLRLSAPRSSSPFFLDEVIAKFSAAYPAVNIEVIYDDKKVDLVTSGIDAAIRSQTLLENETHAVQIGPKLDMALVASPAYLERNGTPKKPMDLTNHDSICFAFGRADSLAPWSFAERNKSPYTVTPKPRIIVNDLVSMINFAKAGLGFAYVYRKPIEPFITSGELVTLFDKHIPPLPQYTINYLTKRHMPARLRAFIDLAKTL
ncbi:LysR family transcriptional regulator [Kordiimonas aquimaris]|uniref:LysR family transcriptional regulator n=1 Tax=Kordiimonas aquimaris TaxID=707591 RepID=UPI0021D2936A|nr:LysR family transcriptional regulator [Kordiimonas aquimaris]